MRFWSIAAYVSLDCALSSAQMNVAEIAGAVQDMSGGAIIHASVTAVNTETNVKFTSATDDSGHFRVAELPPGDYSLTVRTVDLPASIGLYRPVGHL
jgi:hypothetical protein